MRDSNYFYILLEDDLNDSIIKMMKEHSIEITDENIERIRNLIFPVFKEKFAIHDYSDYINCHMSTFIDNGDIDVEQLKKATEVQ